jgi:hypothetical protein
MEGIRNNNGVNSRNGYVSVCGVNVLEIEKRKEKLTKKHKLTTVYCCRLHEQDETGDVLEEENYKYLKVDIKEEIGNK